MPLRQSQVETLRYIGEGENGRTMTECSMRFSVVDTEMWRELEDLRLSGHLRRRAWRFYLTQLGRKALEGQK